MKLKKIITDHDQRNKYLTTQEFNKLTALNFAARSAQANLASKVNIDNFIKKTYFDDKLKNLNEKITSNKTNQTLVENEFIKLQTIYSRLFIGQSNFFIDGAQLYLIFQTIYYIFKRLGDTEKFVSWKSKGSSAEKLATATTADNSLFPSINWFGDSNFCLSFKGS